MTTLYGVVRTSALVGFGLSALVTLGATGCDNADLKGSQAEVAKTTIKLDMPTVPEFTMPQSNSDGTKNIRELRLIGRKIIGDEIRIRGFVSWVYDCAVDLRKPGMTEKDVEKVIEEDPSRCSRPHLILGDAADTPSEKGVWVVEVPRELRKDELKLLDKQTIKELPPVPVFALGDEVIVSGKWDRRSPKGFANSDGLLIYGSMENLTQPAEEPKK